MCVVLHPATFKVSAREWFSWLKRFRGVDGKPDNVDDGDLDPVFLLQTARGSGRGGLDDTWTANLKLAITACDLRAQKRLTFGNLDMEVRVQWVLLV